MAGQKLDERQFQTALGAYEGMRRARVGELNQDVAHREVLRQVEQIFPGFADAFSAREEERRNEVKNIRIGRLIRREGGFAGWYSGPNTSMGEWPDYRTHLEKSGFPSAAVSSIDKATTRILSGCANPMSPGDKSKGLVIGYVQSGKTANYTGLIAKAVDAGYRIVIVLAGMYTNLRVQTQLRLQKDLGMDEVSDSASLGWWPLTSATADLGRDISTGPLSNPANVAVMVVKKHEMRLANVARFLESIPSDILRRRGVLIIDDESDQATPNTQAARDLVSTINQRIRSIWAAVPTGTYVAYTATPFANVFIDPADSGDLYPDDFAMVLPQPEGYMGSEAYFDVSENADREEDEPVHQLAHEVPEEEAAILAPKGRDLSDFDPVMTHSLAHAVRWFVLATAIRELRAGRSQHSSMLVHTSQRITVHQLTKDIISDFIKRTSFNIDEQESEFRDVYDSEIDRASGFREGESVPAWAETWDRAKAVLARVTVKIDNGASDDRLVYSDEETETVIAVGGGTLSRGLTLEGLVVSYFLRSSNTYDTLLQMGRWFGFRPGYRDLVRVWMGPGLLDDYAHLARVERQLRDEVATMEEEKRTPREFAIRVRAHPGRLEITSPGKMNAADLVHFGLGGTRRQTIYLDTSPAGVERGQRAARNVIESARSRTAPIVAPSGRSSKGYPTLMFPGLENEDVVRFLRDYWVAPADRWLQPEAMEGWLDAHGQGATWNLVVISGPGGGADGFEIADGIRVGTSSRAPMAPRYWDQSRLDADLPAGADLVNIRALMSSADYLLDLKILAEHGALAGDVADRIEEVNSREIGLMQAEREDIAPHTGTLILYAIDAHSQPKKDSTTRVAMDAAGTIIGLGVVYPPAKTEDRSEYYAVAVPEATDDEEGPITPKDDEDDFRPSEES
jgi:hypothetical protein